MNNNLNSRNRSSRNRNSRLNNNSGRNNNITNNVINTIDETFQNIFNLQNTIDSVVDEYANVTQNRNIFSNVRNRTNIRQPNQNNSNSSNYVEYISFLHALRDIMIGYNNNIRDYNSNIREYNNNINSFLQIMSSIQHDLSIIRTQQFEQTQINNNQETNPENSENQDSSGNYQENNGVEEQQHLPIENEETRNTGNGQDDRRTIETLIYDIISRMDLPNISIQNLDSSFNNVTENISNNIRRNMNRPRHNNRRTISETISYYTTFIPTNTYTNLRDVVIRPSVEQISNATEEISYSTNHSRYTFTNTTCPITLEEFQEGEILRRINHCGHVFRESAIQNWFRQNVRCPVCRYDIRDYIPPQSNDFSVNSELDDLRQQEIDTEVELERTRINYDTETQRQSDISMNNYMLNENQTPIDSFHDATNEIFNEITNEFSNLINQYLTNNNDNYNSDLIYSIEFEPIYADVFDISLDRTID
jgi:hypothetical protein